MPTFDKLTFGIDRLKYESLNILDSLNYPILILI